MGVLPLAPGAAPVGPSMPLVDLLGSAERLIAAGRNEEAIATYRTWLDGTTSPLAYAVHFNLAVLLGNLQDRAGAEQEYRNVIAVNPAFLQAYLNLGTQLEQQGRADDALAQWRHILEIATPVTNENREFLILALNNLGRLLEIGKQLQQAEAMLKKSLDINPNQSDVLYHWVHLRQKQCKWPIYEAFNGITVNDMVLATSPLASLSETNDPLLQLTASRRFVEKKVMLDAPHLSSDQGYEHKKLRVGYLSSDFCSHAISILAVELFELHDRSKIEVYGFSWSREDGTSMRARVVKALDNYIPIGAMTDEAAAKCIRSHEIDILVDLQGLTSGTRPNILSYRPAPVQVTYLGFVGPTALPSIDYVIADRFVLPDELRPFFTEKPLYMPHSYQINDRKREIGPKPTRALCKLPEDAFVFCSFNNSFKITPDIFSAWMRILLRVPDSVLWVVADGPEVRANLVAATSAQGVDPARLIFAERVSPADYLARYQVADLFLDTMPFNGGTTASDALWAGLPLVTYSGRTFSSRMAGSLLLAVDLPELITTSLLDYENLAVSLGNDRSRVEAMKHKLVSNRLTCPLFDSPQFVKDLEGQFQSIAKTPSKKKLRLAVYTVLVGEKEALNNPLHYLGNDAPTDLDIEFFCFTDNEALISSAWKIKRFNHPLVPPEKMSRLPKAQPDKFFPDYDYSLYIDNTVVFKRLPQEVDVKGAVFRGFRHPWRTNPLDEADIVVKSGLDAAEIVAGQIAFYDKRTPLSSVTVLTAGTVLLRQHHHPSVQKFGELWWEQILLFSKRDQISLDLCAQIAGCPVERFDGDKTNNDLFVWPVLPNGRRVQGSFDAERYAWEKRSDPEALRQPRTHFLAHGGDGSKFERHVPWFRYACDRAGSSLGDSVPPRRGIADIVGSFLAQMGARPGGILIAGIRSEEPYAVEMSELLAAKAAVGQFFRYTGGPEVTVSMVDEAQMHESAPFLGANGRAGFQLVLVLGLPSKCHKNAFPKFSPLLASNGTLLVEFGSGLSVQGIDAMQSAVPERAVMQVFHGKHILSDQVIPSSVFALRLG